MRRNTISAVLLVVNILMRNSSSQLTCSNCLENLGMEWCMNRKSLNSSSFTRCLTNENQRDEWEQWCGEENVYRPANIINTIKDDPFTNPLNIENNENIIQIKPQVLEMKLLPGKTQTVDVKFKYVRGYSLQLYYLMDMSKSMEQDKETIIQLADDLASELKRLTPNLKLGFGSFLDKVMLPYVNTHSSWLENPCQEVGEKTCRVPYGYQNILSLTNNTEQFIESVRSAKLSTNWDDPEGGLDALVQSMVCDDIGWEAATTRHLIVYVSGSAFKYAGDGKLAGLTLPNDKLCHLDSRGMYTYSSIQDYPSIAQIESISQEKRMHVIFAVKANVLPLYEAVSNLIIQSEASELREDSSNIIEIITNIYEDISRTLHLNDDSYKVPALKLSYSAKCGEFKPWEEGSSQCEDVDVNEEVQFQISFQLTECMEKDEQFTVVISPQGLDDKLVVKVSSNCECDCENNLESLPDVEECTSRGKVACGICMCNEGFAGTHCECKDDLGSIDSSSNVNCRRPDDQSGRDCSGHGICKCGQCECQRGVNGDPTKMYQGKFCECSNFDCPKSSSLICSGHGNCECNQCTCSPGWTGDSCSCDQRKDNCVNTVNNKICSGNGVCICNQCKCNYLPNDKSKRYFGKFCEDCESCEGQCGTYNECIQCKIYSTGPIVDKCETKCSPLEIIQVDKIDEKPNQKRCSYKNEEGCLILSAYNPSIEKVVYVQREPNCSGRKKFYVVIGSMIVLILLIGLLLLVIWKCYVTIKDNREFKKFIRESEEGNFTQTMNPLYKDPITRVTNPLRGIDDS